MKDCREILRDELWNAIINCEIDGDNSTSFAASFINDKKRGCLVADCFGMSIDDLANFEEFIEFDDYVDPITDTSRTFLDWAHIFSGYTSMLYSTMLRLLDENRDFYTLSIAELVQKYPANVESYASQYDNEDLQALAKAAFDECRNHCDEDIQESGIAYWIAENHSKLVSKFAQNPYEICEFLDDFIAKTEYADPITGLTKPIIEWAECFSKDDDGYTDELYDIVWEKKVRNKELHDKLEEIISKPLYPVYYSVPDGNLRLSLTTHPGIMSIDDLREKLVAAMKKSVEYGEDWIGTIRFYWDPHIGPISPSSKEELEDEDNMEYWAEKLTEFTGYNDGYTEHLLRMAGVGKELKLLSDEDRDYIYFIDEEDEPDTTIDIIMCECLNLESPCM